MSFYSQITILLLFYFILFRLLVYYLCMRHGVTEREREKEVTSNEMARKWRELFLSS